jgi:hypothetical protein
MDQLLRWSWLVLFIVARLWPYLRIYLFRPKNDERYLRQQAQGPFVPTGEEKHE